jgi:hypothetical protein
LKEYEIALVYVRRVMQEDIPADKESEMNKIGLPDISIEAESLRRKKRRKWKKREKRCS